MKQMFSLLAVLLLLGGTASAQRLMVGVRGGVNFTDYSFGQIRIGDVRFSPGSSRAGYEAGLVVRLNLTKHLHLQSELNYVFANYDVQAVDTRQRTVVLRTERLQIPVELGFQFGVLRIFGGVQFRIAQMQHSSAPTLLTVGFNDSDVALLGGLGIHVRKFFLDFRISGYPRGHVWQTFSSNQVSRRVKVPHDIVYGGSLGFFF